MVNRKTDFEPSSGVVPVEPTRRMAKEREVGFCA